MSFDPRNAAVAQLPLVTYGALTVDAQAWQAWWNDRPIRVSPVEFRLLRELVRSGGAAITHEALVRRAWGAHVGLDWQMEHTLRVTICRLRKRLPAACEISNQRYVGYRLTVPGSQERAA